MKKSALLTPFVFAVPFILTSLSAFAFSGNASVPAFLSSQQKAAYAQSDSFLQKLGFEDYISQIEHTLDHEENLSAVVELTLNRNLDFYDSFNGSRRLGNLLYAVLKDRSEADIASTIDFILPLLHQQLSHFPMMMSDPLSDKQVAEIKKLPAAEVWDAKEAILHERAVNRFWLEKKNLLKMFLQLLPPADARKQANVEWLDSNITSAIIDAYTLKNRQQNRLLGHSLIISLVHVLRQQQLVSLEKNLLEKLKSKDVYLMNYVGAQFIHKLPNGDLRGTSLFSGDIALAFSHGQEAFFTALLVQPNVAQDKKIRDSYKLNTKIVDARHFLDNKRYLTLMDKQDTYQSLTDKDKVFLNKFWDLQYAQGFSHSGIVQVKMDRETGISATWIWDHYPERNKVGGVRLMTTQGFSNPDKMLKIGFVHYSPTKLLASYKKQIASRGYMPLVWKGWGSDVSTYTDGSIGPVLRKKEIYNWPTAIDEKTVRELAAYPLEKADEWYQTQVVPRIFKRIHGYLTSREAKVFADGLVSAKDMLYCAQMINMSYLEGINMDLQNSPDKVWEALKYFTSEIQEIMNVSIEHRLVSPSGLAWQHDIFDRLYTINNNRAEVLKHKIQTNPTAAEQYTGMLNSVVSKLNSPVDESDLLTLKKDRIALDIEY